MTLSGGTVTKLRLDGTVDLDADSSVTVGTYTGALTTKVPDGYEVVVNGTTYSVRKVEGVTSTTIYVDGTGVTEGAYTSLADAFIALAGGGKIIISGDTTLSEPLTVPEFFGDITVTSEKNAKLTLSANLGFAKNENGKSITFDLPVDTTSAVKLLGGYHSVTFTENFTVDGTLHFFGGMDCTQLTENEDAIAELPYEIIVNGGTFGKFAAGSVRSAATMVGSVATDVTVTINNGKFNNGVSLSGQSILAADATLNINGGTFTHPIHAQATLGAVNSTAANLSRTVASDRDYYAIDGDVTINITGGTFNGGEISAYEYYVAHTQLLRGNFTVNITGGSFTDGTVIDATQVKAYAGENNIAALTYDTDAYTFDIVRFDSVNGTTVTYDEPLRVAFVGDSITEGYAPSSAGVNLLSGSYPARFAANAAADGREVLVSNFGASASGMLPTTHFYYPDMLGYSLVMEEADADYIILALGTNDSPAGGAAGTMQAFIDEYIAIARALGNLPETDKLYITSAILYNTRNMSLTNTRLTSVVRPLQERIANSLASDNNKFEFIDMYGLTLDAASEEGFLSTDLVHPTKAGYIAMGDAVYGAIFNGDTADYRKTDVYVSEDGTAFGAGTVSDPTSRLDIALSMLTPDSDVTLHIVGTVECVVDLALPIAPNSLTIVGEGTDAVISFGGEKILCGTNVKFDNITLSATSAAELYGRFNSVELTDSVSLSGDWSFYAGYPVYTADETEKLNDTVTSVSDSSDITVKLNGVGEFTMLSLGNNALVDASPIGEYAGSMSAEIGQNISATEAKAIGDNTLSGSITVTYPDTMTISGGDNVTLTSYTPEIVLHTYENGVCTECGYVYPYSTVYVSGIGTGDGTSASSPMASHTNAAEAVPNGGTIVFVGDLATPTNAVWTLPAKALTITSENGAVLTLGRTLRLGGDLTLKNITIANGATAGQDFIYSCGHAFIVESSVTTVAHTSNGRYHVLYASSNTENTVGGNLVLRGGTWRSVFIGSYSKAVSGDITVEIDGATVTNSVVAGNSNGGTNTANISIDIKSGTVADITKTTYYTGTYAVTLTGGSVTKLRLDGTVDLTAGGSVTLNEYTGTLATKAPDGYEVVSNEGVYTLSEKQIVTEPKTVYLDGTGKTEGAYTSLSAALNDMPSGGTIILSGDTEIKTATTLPDTEAVVITSKYNGEDYTETAALKIYANLTFGADTTFSNVVIERAKTTSGNIFLVAAGNSLTMDEGVICLNFTSLQWLSIVGGNLTADYEGDAHVTVKSGYFRNIIAGNYNGSFTGNTYLIMTGGKADNAVVGGNFNGNFTGDTHITFGGEAAIIVGSGTPQGLVGGTLGVNGSTAYTHKGNIYLTMCDNSAAINVFGASRNNNITTVGDVTFHVKDNAAAFAAVFGAGHTSNTDGNVHFIIDSGLFKGNVFGGGYQGNVSGDITMEINGGKLCYYNVTTHASGSWPAGTSNLYAACQEGTVGGDVMLTMKNAYVYGDAICGGKETSATVGGSATAIVSSGKIFGKLASVGTATVDLSDDTTVEIGVESDITYIIGGGKLILAAAAPLTVDTLSGTTELAINGVPLPIAYITAKTVETSASVTYTSQATETLVNDAGTYKIDFAGACEKVEVTVNFNEGCNAKLYKGGSQTPHSEVPASTEVIEAVSTTATTATYTLTPGYYTVCVNYTDTATYANGNYRYKAIYVYGNSPTQSVTVDFPAAKYEGFEIRYGTSYTDEILEEFYDTSDLVGFGELDTPYFNDREGSPIYSTNEEVADFVAAKDKICDWMYAFDHIKTANGYTVPYAIFTMDDIPAGATPEEIAKIVGSEEGREILIFTGGIHGNEPCGTEGALAFISEMCGEYGVSVLDGTNIGAVIVFPRVNPEGFYIFTRGTPYNPVNTNLNRDYMMLGDVATAEVVRMARLFNPTIFVDYHEAYQGPIVSDGDIMTDIYDIGLSFGTSLSGNLMNTKDVLYGDIRSSVSYGDEINADVMARLGEIGIRSHYYEKRPMTACGQNYFSNLGTYGFFSEVPGLLGGSENIARRTFVQMSTMKTFVELAIDYEGAIAKSVAEIREAVTKSAQIYDSRSAVDLLCKQSHIGYSDLYTWNNPLVAMDATVRESENLISQYNYDVMVKYRTRPTAYVFPADVEKLDEVLSVLDKQGIAYYLLDSSTTLTLQQYSGDSSLAYLSDAAEFSFENGAYIVPVDGYLANIIAILFEPENFNAQEGSATFVMAGYLNASDIYRSTESFIAAKMGLDGTYVEVTIPEGKKVTSATVDGTVYDGVNTEDSSAFVLASDSEHYAVTLAFADGTSETTYIGELCGDVNGDHTISIHDALLAIRALVNDAEAANADTNGDGKLTLLDVIRLMKMMAN